MNTPNPTHAITDLMYKSHPNPSTGVTNPQGGGPGGAAHQLATQLSQSSVRQKIVTMCNAIEAEMRQGVRPDTRFALGNFLVKNNIQNPGGLTGRQEQICTWVGLEAIEGGDRNNTSALSGLLTFAPEDAQRNEAINLSQRMGF